MKNNISKLKSSITNPNNLNYVSQPSFISGSNQKKPPISLTNPEINKNNQAINSIPYTATHFSSNYDAIFKSVLDQKLNSDKKFQKNFSSQQNQDIHKVGPIKFGRKNHSNSKLIVDQAPILLNNYESMLNKQKQWKAKKSLSFNKLQKTHQISSAFSSQIQQKEKLQSQIILQWSKNKEQLKQVQNQFQNYKRISQECIERLKKENEILTNQLKKQKEENIKKIVQLQLQLASIPQQVIQQPVFVQTQSKLQKISYKQLGQSFQQKINELYDQNYRLKNTIGNLQSQISQIQIKNSSLQSTINAFQQRDKFQSQINSKSSTKKEIQKLRMEIDKMKDQKNMLISQYELEIMKLENQIQLLKQNNQSLYSFQNNVQNSIHMQELRILAKDQFAQIIQLKRQKKILQIKLKQIQKDK